MRGTLRLIGQAIKRGATYLPLRNHAAALATTAPPKNYLAQVKAIYDDAINRWRYVKDPVRKELLTFEPHALWQLVLAGDGIGVGSGKGAGDCDCISAAIGAELEAIGIPVRLGVTAPPGSPPGKMFAHVFVQARVPGHGWITVDPVLHPHRQFGAVPRHSRIAFFDLDGNLTGSRGNVVGLSGDDSKGEIMSNWDDMGFAGADDGSMPEDLRDYGLPDFGAYVDTLGYEDGDRHGLLAESQPELIETLDGKLTLGVRTPILELTPKDMRYVRKFGRPYTGMGAVDETGAIYEFDGSLGFFTKIIKAAKSIGKKVAGKAGKLFKKLGGKYLIRIGKKILKVAKKYVRPLIKFVGKYATKLAPVAALIPGYGPAIAAGLYTAGKVAKLMEKYDVKLFGKKGKARTFKFKSKKKSKQFRAALKKAAKKENRKRKSMGKSAYTQMIKGKAKKKRAFAGTTEYEQLAGRPVGPYRRLRRMRRRARRIAAGLPVRRGPGLRPLRRLPIAPRRRKLLKRQWPHLFR